MSELLIHDRPELRRPILIAAWTGWNDAGEAASSALRFMARRWRAPAFAEIDPEEFYDFTQARPTVRLEKGERVLEWPPNKFTARRLEDQQHDLILLQGTEPHIGWRTYRDSVLELCDTFDVGAVITLGALLSEVSHARKVRVTGASTDESLRARLRLADGSTSRYEGPTGIVGVLGQSIRERGIATASLWANIPFYVQRTPNPKGALALLERLNSGLSLELTLHDLEVFAARFDAQVAADIGRNAEIAEIARRIEAMTPEDEEDDEQPAATPEELPDAESMVEELDRFFKQQRSEEEE